MVFTSASARGCSKVFGQANRVARTTKRTRSWQQVQKRTYASGGDHGSHQKSAFSGDLPWAIGSLIVTVPSVWYLAQPQIERMSGKKGSHGVHGHEGEGHDDHGEVSEGSEDGDEGKEESGEVSGAENSEAGNEEGTSGEDDQGDEDSRESEEGADSESSGSQGGHDSAPATPGDKGSDNVQHERSGGQDVEGVQFKGPTSGGSREGEQGDTRKHIPDAKGGNKARIESHYGGVEGKATSAEQSPENGDLAAQSKQPGSMNVQSGKQAGLSNANTKHSTDIANDPDKSRKSTGGPETAKEQGTVDARRPQAQQNEI